MWETKEALNDVLAYLEGLKMADHFIGLDRGEESTNVSLTTGAATGSTDVEVRVADAAGWTREELILALRKIERYWLQSENVGGPTFPNK